MKMTSLSDIINCIADAKIADNKVHIDNHQVAARLMQHIGYLQRGFLIGCDAGNRRCENLDCVSLITRQILDTFKPDGAPDTIPEIYGCIFEHDKESIIAVQKALTRLINVPTAKKIRSVIEKLCSQEYVEKASPVRGILYNIVTKTGGRSAISNMYPKYVDDDDYRPVRRTTSPRRATLPQPSVSPRPAPAEHAAPRAPGLWANVVRRDPDHQQETHMTYAERLDMQKRETDALKEDSKKLEEENARLRRELDAAKRLSEVNADYNRTKEQHRIVFADNEMLKRELEKLSRESATQGFTISGHAPVAASRPTLSPGYRVVTSKK
jgi:hypothetical protein